MVRPPPRPSHRRARRGQAGFTLVELLTIVTIIAVTAALAGPAMYGAFAEQKTGQASMELVRLVQRARAEAGAYGRAHLVRFDGTGDGIFTVYRGVSSSCQANVWDAEIIAEGACGTASSMCVDQLDFVTADGGYNYGSLDVRVVEEVSGDAIVDLCYEPTGRVLHRTGGAVPLVAVFSDQNTVDGGYRFRFDRYEGGVLTGVSRRVATPLGADARVMR